MSRMGPFSVVVMLAVLFIRKSAVDACKGFTIVVHKVNTECKEGKSIFTLSDDVGVTLTPDCKIIPAGCAEMAEGFDNATVLYEVTPGKMMPKLRDERNLCELFAQAKNNQEAVNYLQMFNLPTECPVTAGKICSEGKVIDLAEKNVMIIPGIVEGYVEIITTSGSKACLNFIIEMKRVPK